MSPDNAELVAQITRAQDAINTILEGALMVNDPVKRTRLNWYIQEMNNSIDAVTGTLSQ